MSLSVLIFGRFSSSSGRSSLVLEFITAEEIDVAAGASVPFRLASFGPPREGPKQFREAHFAVVGILRHAPFSTFVPAELFRRCFLRILRRR